MVKKIKTPPSVGVETPVKPPGSPRQKNVLALRGTEDWKLWLDGFADSKGMPVTVLVDHALRELAKRDGYQDPPTRIP